MDSHYSDSIDSENLLIMNTTQMPCSSAIDARTCTFYIVALVMHVVNFLQ